MKATRINGLFLPGITLSSGLQFTNDLAAAVRDKDFLLLVVPSQVMRSVLQQVVAEISPATVVASASKGIEVGTLMAVSQLFEELLPAQLFKRFTVLSGPSFAREVAQEMPTAVVAASADEEAARFVQEVFTCGYFRVYTNNDVIGAELGGALKNVIAIAAGISDGLGFGCNTRAALITRGLAEISRLGLALGAKPETFSGLAGMGDLVLTCTGELSRNRSVGMKLGRGRRLSEILGEMHMVAEGVKTAESAWALAQRHTIDMPITEQVYKVLYEDKPARSAVVELMTRNLKAEGI
jgi:glycerol-3-phosphate dehydrogenase (NAD(P)+)